MQLISLLATIAALIAESTTIAMSPAAQQTPPFGSVELRVRDIKTGMAVASDVFFFPLSGDNVATQPTRALSLTTTVILELNAGCYPIEVSAEGYQPLRTHLDIATQKTYLATVYLVPTTLPVELTSEALDSLVLPTYSIVHGYVADALVGSPIAGAYVSLAESRVASFSDGRGYFALLVPAQGDGVGVLSDTLTVAANGYAPNVMRKVSLTEGATQFNITLERPSNPNDPLESAGSADALRQQDLSDEPDVSNATGRHEEWIPLSASAHAPSPALLRWLGRAGRALRLNTGGSNQTLFAPPVIPNSIRVGYQCPTTSGPCPTPTPKALCLPCKRCCTAVMVIPFDQYLKRGLWHEWPSWYHANSLRAGAVAYRSYAAYHVAHPSSCSSPSYDIRNDTCNQVFNISSVSTQPDTDAAIDYTAGVVLTTSEGSIYKAEYSAETNTGSDRLPACPDGATGDGSTQWPCMIDGVCATNRPQGHGRGMCQNGTQRWATGYEYPANGSGVLTPSNPGSQATAPRDWMCILDHYYNDNGNSMGKGTGKRTAYLHGAERFRRVLVHRDSDPLNSIGVMSQDGSGFGWSLVQGLVEAVEAPCWSQIDGRVAFSAITQRVSSVPLWNLFSAKINGTDLTQITIDAFPSPLPNPSSIANVSPSWSPDGTKIAFAHYDLNLTSSSMQIVDSSGLNRSALFVANGVVIDMSPSWDPSGERIAFVNDLGLDNPELWIVQANGASPLALTTGSADSQPAWSPDGKRIAFVSYYGTNHSDIYVINSDGTGRTRLTTQTSNEDRPRWSADGRKILFNSDRTGRWQVYSMVPASGAAQTQLTFTTATYAFDCQWCPRFD